MQAAGGSPGQISQVMRAATIIMRHPFKPTKLVYLVSTVAMKTGQWPEES